MDAETENRIRLEQMESFGSLLAGFSHDMRNHLAVIRESNGLIEDILAMDGRAEDDPTMVQLKKAVALIEQRINMSADLYTHLSGLAHRSDTPLSSFYVNDLMTELIVFLARSARSRQIDLRMKPGSDIQTVYNDPALLQHVVYRLYVSCLNQLEKGQSLVMSTAQEKEYAVIIFRLLGISQVDLAALSDMSGSILSVVSKLEGKLENKLKADDDGVDSAGIKLLIPSLETAL